MSVDPSILTLYFLFSFLAKIDVDFIISCIIENSDHRTNLCIHVGQNWGLYAQYSVLCIFLQTAIGNCLLYCMKIHLVYFVLAQFHPKNRRMQWANPRSIIVLNSGNIELKTFECNFIDFCYIEFKHVELNLKLLNSRFWIFFISINLS